MSISDVIKAYEIFRSHGLDVRSLLVQNQSSKNLEAVREIEPVAEINGRKTSILDRNINSQWRFLNQLAHEGKTALERNLNALEVPLAVTAKARNLTALEVPTIVAARSKIQDDEQLGFDKSRVYNDQRNNEKTSFRVCAAEEQKTKLSSTVEIHEEQEEDNKNNFEDFTLSELLKMREDVEEIYGT